MVRLPTTLLFFQLLQTGVIVDSFSQTYSRGRGQQQGMASCCNQLFGSISGSLGDVTNIDKTSIRRNTHNTNTRRRKKQLGLLTFDLDDTLFHCGDVVKAANKAMLQAIHDKDLDFATPSCGDEKKEESTTIPEFLATTKSIRQELDAPITYQELRTRAIYATLQQRQAALTAAATSSSSSTSDLGSAEKNLRKDAEACYDVWIAERHAAAEQCLLDGAIPMLKQIQSQFPATAVVAITNGAGSPLEMPNTLQPYFDDCISGEHPDVFPNRKPDTYIYEYTLNRHYTFENGDDSTEMIWCHVGDCLVNDVQASSLCGAKAIWLNTKADSDHDKQPFYSTATPEEQQARKEKAKKAEGYVAAEINSLEELPNVIMSLLVV